MKSSGRIGLMLSLVALAWLGMALPVGAAQGGIKSGILTCNVDSGFGYILGSSRDVKCTYAPASGKKSRDLQGYDQQVRGRHRLLEFRCHGVGRLRTDFRC